jgi:hypothetical protein
MTEGGSIILPHANDSFFGGVGTMPMSTVNAYTRDVTDWYKRTVRNSDTSKSGVSIRSGVCGAHYG